MRITWLGHSCFVMQSGGYAIALDPYADGSVPGLRPLSIRANAVLCSHDHHDHNAVDAVTRIDPHAPSPFTVTRVESFHDTAGGAKRGPNTIHVLEAEGVRAAHLGDLGTMLTEAQTAQIGRLDALLVPVGGYYTIDAKTAADVVRALRPTVVLPMHYRLKASGFAEIGTLHDFLALSRNVRRYDTNTIEITPQTGPQTAVLTRA